jgi:hypothetical protein
MQIRRSRLSRLNNWLRQVLCVFPVRRTKAAGRKRSRAAIDNPSASISSPHLRNSIRLICLCCALRLLPFFVPGRLHSLGQIVPLGASPGGDTKAICPRSLQLHEKPGFAGPPFQGRHSLAVSHACKSCPCVKAVAQANSAK